MVCCISASPPYGFSLPPYYSTFVTSAERFETSALELALAKNCKGFLLASIQRSAWRDCLETAPRHDDGLRSAPWRSPDTPRICPTTNGSASARIFPNPREKDAPGCTA